MISVHYCFSLYLLIYLCLCVSQTWYLFLIAVMLVTRTYCDVWMIQNGTMIERYCVDPDFKFVSAVKYITISLFEDARHPAKYCLNVI